MKKILIILAMALSLVSCKKALTEDPLGQIAGDNALSTVNGLQAALSGTYQPLTNNFSSGFLSAAIDAVVMGDDELTTHPGLNKGELREFDQFDVSPANSRLDNIWKGCYKSIQGSNNIINNYKRATGDAATINQIVGEAYYLRAMNYYWLTRLCGSIPLITSATYDPAVLKIKTSPPAEVYKLIESDLTNSKGLLADKPVNIGRASKGAAIALLADVYLTEGGWPINDPSKYSLAAAAAKEVIDHKDIYGFDLVPDLHTLWANTYAGTGTSEEVFALHACASCGDFNPVYGASSIPGDEGGWDDYFSELTFFNEFPAGVRKDITFITVIKNSDGSTIPWQSDAVKHPYFGKFSVGATDVTYNTSGTQMLMRYAHVLLIYAEAQARSEGSVNTQAYACINSIRARAGLPNLSGLSKADFITATINERAWEFAGESTRWFDIVRLQILKEVNAKRDHNEIPIIGPVKYTFPIPSNDVILNPGLGGN